MTMFTFNSEKPIVEPDEAAFCTAHKINGTIVSATILGHDIYFFVADKDDLIQKEHLEGEFYESNELEIISRFFHPGSTFVDIGANVGNHTVYVARFLSPLNVIVIEPNPSILAIIKANIALNQIGGCVDVSHLGIGLSNISAQAVAMTPAGNLGGTRLEFSEHGSLRIVPGDAILSGHRIDFLKIDVEGMEVDVLDGLKRTIAEQRPRIFIEVDNCNVAKFFEWTKINNYSIVASGSGRTVRSVSPSTPGYENFMLIPDASVMAVPIHQPDARFTHVSQMLRSVPLIVVRPPPAHPRAPRRQQRVALNKITRPRSPKARRKRRRGSAP